MPAGNFVHPCLGGYPTSGSHGAKYPEFAQCYGRYLGDAPSSANGRAKRATRSKLRNSAHALSYSTGRSMRLRVSSVIRMLSRYASFVGIDRRFAVQGIGGCPKGGFYMIAEPESETVLKAVKEGPGYRPL